MATKTTTHNTQERRERRAVVLVVSRAHVACRLANTKFVEVSAG